MIREKILLLRMSKLIHRRRFTESVCNKRVKSGVLGIDSKNKIFLVNKSAIELLEFDALVN